MLDGRELRILRETLEITLVEIANRMCTTKQTISNLELGKSNNRSALKFYNVILFEIINERDLLKQIDEKIKKLEEIKKMLK